MRATSARARESLDEAFERIAGVPEDERARRLADVSLELVLTAHPTEATRRTFLLAHVRIARLLGRLDDADARGREEIETTLAEEITILWQTDEVRQERRRVVDEIRQGLWFFESSLMHVGERLLAAYRRRLPEAPPPFSFGTWIGGDLDGNPAAGAETILEALARARELALARYRAEVRGLAMALASNRSLVHVSPELDESIARDERELPEYAASIGTQSELEPYRRKLSFVWWRLGNDGYANPDALLEDLAVLQRSLRAAGGARDRGRKHRNARAPRRAVRLPRRKARRAPPRERDPRADGTYARRVRGRLGGARAARPARARHGDRLRDVVARGRSRRARAHGRGRLRRPAVRDDRRPRGRAAHRARAARGRALRRARRRARRAAGGDGRLLGLRQGRRLPRGAVGDLPRAAGARGRCRGGGRRADDLPRTRRQRGTRWRPDARGHPRAGAGPAAGAPEADGAGRDDLVQVRVARARAAQSRDRAGGNRPRGVPGRRRAHAQRRRACAAGQPRCGVGVLVSVARPPRAVLHGVLPRVHAGGRARAAGDRLAPGAAARRPRLLRVAAGDPVGVRLDAESDAAAGVVRLRNGVCKRRCGRRYGASIATCRSFARSSTTSR